MLVPLASLVALLLVADFAYTSIRLHSSLQQTRTALARGVDLFRDGKVTEARTNFENALRLSNSAEGLTGQPVWTILRGLPVVDGDAQGVEAIAVASQFAAHAGIRGTRAAGALGVREGTGLSGSVYREGTVQFDVLDSGSTFVSQAAGLLDKAEGLLTQAPRPTFGFLEEVLKSAQSEVGRASESADRAETLLRSLPNLLGRDASRTYLLAFQALGEARATGGVIGLYGVLETRKGRLHLTKIAPFDDLFPNRFPAVDAPKWFKANYGPQLALSQWQQANLSPNFPAVARVLLNMYEAQSGQRLQGVIAMDPVTLALTMQGTGPIVVPQLDKPITSTNVADVLLRDSYIDFPNQAAQNILLKNVVKEFWKKVSRGNVEGPKFVKGLAEAARTQHLKVYSDSAPDEEALALLGLDGSYKSSGPNVQLVFANNNATNKVDYYLSRTIDTRVQLESTGKARVRTKITLRNKAPSGPPSLLLGPTLQDIPPGMNSNVLNVLVPKGAEITSLSINNRRAAIFEHEDSGFPVAGNLVEVPAGDTATMIINYRLPKALPIPADGGTFDFTLFPQTTFNPDTFTFAIAPPKGYSISTDDPAATLRNGYIYSRGVLDEPRALQVALTIP